jgi:hypothetical protein
VNGWPKATVGRLSHSNSDRDHNLRPELLKAAGRKGITSGMRIKIHNEVKWIKPYLAVAKQTRINE